MMMEPIYQLVITIVNICVPNIIAPKYVKHILMDLMVEIDCSTIIVGDFSSPFYHWADHLERKL